MVLQFIGRYKDGTDYEITDSTPYPKIPREGLDSIEVLKDNNPYLHMFLDEGAKLVWRRRITIHSDGTQAIVYVLGWRMSVGGKNIQNINYIFEDANCIIQMNRFRPDMHAIFCSPELLPEEKVGDES